METDDRNNYPHAKSRDFELRICFGQAFGIKTSYIQSFIWFLHLLSSLLLCLNFASSSTSALLSVSVLPYKP